MTSEKTEKLGWNVRSDLKKSFQKMVKEKHEGKKRNFCKREIENAMKLYLALQGEEKYQDDPDVKEYLDSLPKLQDHTHIQKPKAAVTTGYHGSAYKITGEQLLKEFDHDFCYDKQIHREDLKEWLTIKGIKHPQTVESRIIELKGFNRLAEYNDGYFEILKNNMEFGPKEENLVF